MVQVTRRTRKQRVDAAIAYALDRRWDLAAAENQALLEEFPDDIESANRLGKALTELGDLDGARKAYQHTLELDSTNVIARRNLSRIEEMRGSQPRRRTTKRAATGTAASAASVETVRPHSLIEESGKSAEFELLGVNAQGLRRVSAGDPAELVVTQRGISVRSASGAELGHIEPRAGLRLKRLIEGGNRYAAVIRRVGEDDASIYVRETYRAPALADQPSFLPPATSARKRLAPRAYTKASIVRYQADGDGGDESEDEDGEGGWTPRSRRAEEDEFEESGFSDDDSLSDDDDDSEDLSVDDEDEPIVDEDEEM
jgi:tetratricopeptide (TPR) repeat protein